MICLVSWVMVPSGFISFMRGILIPQVTNVKSLQFGVIASSRMMDLLYFSNEFLLGPALMLR